MKRSSDALNGTVWMGRILMAGRRQTPLALLIPAALVISVPALIGPVSAQQAAWPPPLAPRAQRADAIRVDKSERRMELQRDGRTIRTYRILLGDAPVGHKRQQGDEKTPEGDYRIDFRNGASRFHLSLRVSYPNRKDRAQARARGVSPGGDIFIHGGTPPGHNLDWTDGCIAVTNAEIEEIWRLVPAGTPIRIDP